jgi:hypothetical protein
MPTKLVFSWADLLLIAVLSTAGAGICALSARVAAKAMADDAPKEAAFQDSAGVPRLERALAAAGEERSAVIAQIRELRFRRMRDSSALGVAEAELRAARPPGSAAADSLARERARLLNSLRTDSALAVRLGAAAALLRDTVAARARSLAAARRSSGELYGAARDGFELWRTLFTAAGALAGVALLLGAARVALRPASGREPGVHASLVLRTTAVVVAVILAHQLLGAPLTLLLGALAALVFLFPRVKHAP